MKRLNFQVLVVLPLLLFSLSLLSQQEKAIHNLDSVYHYAKLHPIDTNAIDLLNSGCNQLYGEFPDTVRYYSEQQVYIARAGNLKEYEGRGYNMWGICLEISGDLDSAITLYQTAKSIGEDIGSDKLLMDVYNNLGIVYSYKGLYELSIEHTVKALSLAEGRQDTVRINMLYNNLGLRYYELNNIPKALEYLNKAIALSELRKDTSRMISNYVNLGNCYLKLEEFDKAISYSKQSVYLAKSAGSKFKLITAYNSLAFSNLRTENLIIASAYNDSSRSISQEIQYEFGIQQARVVDGFVFQKAEEYAKAIAPLEEALEYFEGIKYMNMTQDILINLAVCYHEIGKHELAYDRMKVYALGKDTILTKEKDKAMEQVAIYKEAKQNKEKEYLNQEIDLKEQELAHQKSLRNTFIIIGLLLLIIAAGLTQRYFYQRKVNNEMANKNAVIEKAKKRSDELLLNILPEEVAEELKQKGTAEAKDFDHVTVMFTDFVEFTKAAEALSAKELVKELNICFEAFDKIIEKYKLEKIKTIGDAYMAASGLNKPKRAGAKEATLAALEMQEFIAQRAIIQAKNDSAYFNMRCGLNTGPVVAGIVGVKKFQFDIWGDTVNTAQRMESHGEIGKVNISQETYEALKDDQRFTFENRGILPVKGKGELPMWFVSKSA